MSGLLPDGPGVGRRTHGYATTVGVLSGDGYRSDPALAAGDADGFVSVGGAEFGGG
jgi:hypothetical protein